MRTTVHTDKTLCTGCGACVTICPVGAITMEPDEEGFLYPSVDAKRCIGCNACENRCPAGKIPEGGCLETYGAQHRDSDIRRASSSGGVFSALCEAVLSQGGIVFGAALDEHMNVRHVKAEKMEEIMPLRGSKYVQSDAADAINEAKQLLKAGKTVLFTGTPCQTSGLTACLAEKEREKLLTIDFVCHGVPSPGVFSAYIAQLEKKKRQKVKAFAFRDKRNGWVDFSACATFADGSEHVGSQTKDPFLCGFLKNLYLRPSCTKCMALRGDHHVADITIADLWGSNMVCPEKDNDTGLSLIFVRTQKGQKALDACADSLILFPVDTQKVIPVNSAIVKPVEAHPQRAEFFAQFAKHGFDKKAVLRMANGPGPLELAVQRIAHVPKGIARRIGVLAKALRR